MPRGRLRAACVCRQAVMVAVLCLYVSLSVALPLLHTCSVCHDGACSVRQQPLGLPVGSSPTVPLKLEHARHHCLACAFAQGNHLSFAGAEEPQVVVRPVQSLPPERAPGIYFLRPTSNHIRAPPLAV